MFNYDICVARYNEDLDWLKTYKNNSVIYNKGSELDEKQFKEIVKTKPVGTESYSFFSYIVDHYDNLPEVVAFIQGRVDDHLGDAKNKHSKNDKKNSLIFLDYILNEAYKKGISAPIDETVYDHTDWKLATPDRITGKECAVVKYSNMTEWWENYIGLQWPGPSRCVWCHCFAVRKENILQHPKELYVKIRNDPNFQNTYCEVSHFWERMLFPFFTNKWIDKNL